jgi:hypothetical protein
VLTKEIRQIALVHRAILLKRQAPSRNAIGVRRNKLQGRAAEGGPPCRRDCYAQFVGPIESAVRSAIAPGQRLATPSQGAPFKVEQIDHEGVVLLLAERWWTRLSWECLEGIGPFLQGRGWTPIGSKYATEGTPGTLDGYLKGWVKRATAGWVASLLEAAGVLDIDRGRPSRVRLRAR